MNWSELVERAKSQGLVERLKLPEAFVAKWQVTDSDRKLAWELYSDLRTRITTQPLHYTHGDEATALTSLVDFFRLARDKVRSYGPEARASATLVVFVLNSVIRPFTAEWHKKSLAGVLKQEDARRLFRTKFVNIQLLLRQLASMLAVIAEGDAFCENSESWQQRGVTLTDKQRGDAQKPIPLGLLFSNLVDPKQKKDMHQAECAAIAARRTAMGNANTGDSGTPVDVAGLAISGGGIRSAAFALGAVQELVQRGVMRDFDFLSTVSGGGYLGAFLSSYLNSSDPDNQIGLSKNQLPFRKPEAGESQPLRHLRAHSKYLLVGGLKNTLVMLTMLTYGFLANAMILLPILSLVLLTVAYFSKRQLLACLGDSTQGFIGYVASDNLLLCLLTIGVLAIASIAIVDLISRFAKQISRVPRGSGRTEKIEAAISRFATQPNLLRDWQIGVGYICGFAAILIAWRLVPYGLCRTNSLLNDTRLSSPSWLVGTVGISGVVMFLQRALAAVSTADSSGKLKRFLGFAVLALFGPLLVIAVFLLLGHYTLVAPMLNAEGLVADGQFRLWPLWVLLVLGALVILFVDINQSSLHPFYRWKLSEAFVIRRGTSDDGEAVESNDALLLSGMRSVNQAGPYHLINASLNGPASTRGSFRARGTDFYLFSSKYCGAESVGFFPTQELEEADPKLNLATAMAISGAAASPVTGVVKLPVRRFLLALFNVRLDYWLPNLGVKRIPIIGQIPGPWYLIRQAMGWMDESTCYVNVSDGGHVENLGLYELLRRRCRYIVVIDGECDPKMQCGALVQAQRFAKLDFNVDIDMDFSRFHTSEDGACGFHFALGEIDYHLDADEGHNPRGQLLYIKLSRTGNEPPGVEHYRQLNAHFPHQSTADQFFDEYQFEAYRALGEHATADLFSDEVNPVQPGSLRELFSNVAQALKDPNYL